MAFVTCPTCGEKGKLARELIGKRIKCQKCGTSFLVSAPVKAEAPVGAVAHEPATGAGPVRSAAAGDTIEVEGLDDSAWTTATSLPTIGHEPEPEPPSTVGAGPFVASPHEHTHDHERAPGAKEYKVLTTKDRYFDGKFDPSLLEPALNHYARQGWTVRAMGTPHLAGFSGGMKEELMILMER